MIHTSRWIRFVLLGIASLASDAWAQGTPYINFETIPNRALALSPNGARLFVTNTPDGRLEIFNVSATGVLSSAGSVSVGLDPIAVAARSDTEVWVVNHLSDSVSVVDVSTSPARVVRTLFVGDEPRDIVFAGPGGNRAFISAARRGQNHPVDLVNQTQLPSVPRADVWVFDATNLGSAAGGQPLAIVPLFADKPGALATTPDGTRVLVAIASSGNETTAINDAAVCGSNGQAGQGSPLSAQNDGPCTLPNRGRSPGGVPAPNANQVDGTPNPRTGIIVKFDRATGAWRDGLGRDFRAAVQFSLPDNDVFALDATTTPPRQVAVFRHAGTLNAGLAVHPTNGRTYLATIDAINTNRFISQPATGDFPNPDAAPGVARTADPATGRTLNGHLYESRVAILSPGGGVVSRHLNKHINYEVVPSPAGVKERSVADPRGVTFSSDGRTLFIAALGSNAIASFSTAQLDANSFTPSASSLIPLSGDGGPTDMVIHGNRMFVYKRFDNAVSTVDLALRREIAVTRLFSPEPTTVRVGRKFFYDARLGSSNGEANCNVCHPNADKDDLAWDLGNPFEGVVRNRNPFIVGGANAVFNPLKGPMTVLTLRGIRNSGPMLWRGDATNAVDPSNVRANFANFNAVFPSLLGREGPLAQADFDRFTDWALSILPPPNPHRALNNADTPSQAEGRAVFFGQRGATDGPFNCNSCHMINRPNGFFGTSGASSIEGEPQEFKVTQLRTVYDKVGMFSQTNGENGDPRTLGGPRGSGIGPQVRGFGTLHDGSQAGPEDFLTDEQFQLTAGELRSVVDFVFAFPTNLAPVVGQQVTLRSDSGIDALDRVMLLMQRAAAPFMLQGLNVVRTECDLVAKGTLDGRARGFLFQPQLRTFLDDNGATFMLADLQMLARIPGQELTFTCIYPGGGRRFGIDRNVDGTLDGASVVQPQPQPEALPLPLPQPAPQPQLTPQQSFFLAFFASLRSMMSGMLP